MAHHGRQIDDADHITAVPVATQPRKDAAVPVMEVDPLKALRFEIDLVQRWRRTIGGVQVAHQCLHARMQGLAEQVPVERAVVAPLALLAELAAQRRLFCRYRSMRLSGCLYSAVDLGAGTKSPQIPCPAFCGTTSVISANAADAVIASAVNAPVIKFLIFIFYFSYSCLDE